MFRVQFAKFPFFPPPFYLCLTWFLVRPPSLFPWSVGRGLAGLGGHGALFPVFLLDHNEDQSEDQRERQLQVHWHLGHLWLWELWGESPKRIKSWFKSPDNLSSLVHCENTNTMTVLPKHFATFCISSLCVLFLVTCIRQTWVTSAVVAHTCTHTLRVLHLF